MSALEGPVHAPVPIEVAGEPATERSAVVPSTPRWSLEELAGRLTELVCSGPAAPLTLGAEILWQAQQSGEPAAWVSARQSGFFPPDFAASGIDLRALPVIRTPDAPTAARAAERLLRSSAFGLVVLDLGPKATIPLPLQSRLLALAQKHAVAVLCLTETPAAGSTLGSLVSLRATTTRLRTAPDRFECRLRVLKDKSRGPEWTDSRVYRGPAGLR